MNIKVIIEGTDARGIPEGTYVYVAPIDGNYRPIIETLDEVSAYVLRSLGEMGVLNIAKLLGAADLLSAARLLNNAGR